MRKIFTHLGVTALAIGASLSVQSQTTDLIISEYAEGSSNNKYIEIYNGTGALVDLTNYELRRISNGGVWTENSYSLTGTIADGATMVFANSSADPVILAAPTVTTAFNSATFFNGDDAIGLAKDDGTGTFVVIDAVGTDGADPGSGWDVAGVSDGTVNHTLIRKPTVCSPDTTWSVTAGTTAANSEWIVMPVDDWNNIGQHTTSCGGGGGGTPTGISELFFSRYVEWQHNATSPQTYNHALEIFNGTSSAIDLTNYKVIKAQNGNGWGDVLDLQGSIAPGATFVITRDPNSNNVTISGDTIWASLNISGDDALGLFKLDMNSADSLIDVIGTPNNDPGSGWDVAGVSEATQNNTLLRKLSVCGPDTNWAASAGTTPSNSQWVVLGENNIMQLGTYVSACGQAEPILGFTNGGASATEDDTNPMTADITLSNENMLPVTFRVDYDSANSTAENGVDINFTPITVIIPANTDTTITISYSIIDDMDDEGLSPEEAIIYIWSAVNADNASPVYTIDIMDNDYVIPTYDIEVLRTVDTNYSPDSLGVYCAIEGIVYGADLFGGGYSFTIIDETSGINALSFSDIDGYVVNEGDELRLVGEVGFYNGLTQFEIDSITVLSTGNCIPFAELVFELNEETESEYIYMFNVHLADPSAWPAPGANANLEIVTQDGDTMMMRLDKDTYIADSITSAPTGSFNLTGIGGQFDSSDPYDEGYQIFPMFAYDFDTTDMTPTGLFVNEVMVDNETTITDENGEYNQWVEIYNSNGTDMDLTGYFMYSPDSEPYRFPRCEDPFIVPANGYALVWGDDAEGANHMDIELDDMDTIGLYTRGGSKIDSIYWDSAMADVSIGHDMDGSGNWVMFEVSTPDATNNDGVILSVITQPNSSNIRIFPNPASDIVNFNENTSFEVFNMIGQKVLVANNTNQIDVSNWEKGIYLIAIEDGTVFKLTVK